MLGQVLGERAQHGRHQARLAGTTRPDDGDPALIGDLMGEERLGGAVAVELVEGDMEEGELLETPGRVECPRLLDLAQRPLAHCCSRGSLYRYIFCQPPAGPLTIRADTNH